MKNKLTVYGREGCHLCQEMVEELTELLADRDIQFDIVDVDSSEMLKERYGHLVPVLAGEGGEICHYFLDRAALDAYLGNIR